MSGQVVEETFAEIEKRYTACRGRNVTTRYRPAFVAAKTLAQSIELRALTWQEMARLMAERLAQIARDYDHPWPNEDAGTKSHRESVGLSIRALLLRYRNETATPPTP